MTGARPRGPAGSATRFRGTLREVAFGVIRLTLVPALARLRQRRRLTILLYHDIAPGLFERHLEALARVYHFVSLEAALAALEAGDLRTLPEYPVVITFDDGHRRNAELATLFRRFEVRPTIFLCSSLVDTNRRFWFRTPPPSLDMDQLKRMREAERRAALAQAGFVAVAVSDDERQALSRAEVLAMRDTVDFQSHTRSHALLPGCTSDEARDEIAGSREELGRFLGAPVSALAYPNGDYSPRDLALTRRAGYRCGLTVDPGFNDGLTDRFRLRRLSLSDTGGVQETLVKASGVWAFLRRLFGRQDYGFVPSPRESDA